MFARNFTNSFSELPASTSISDLAPTSPIFSRYADTYVRGADKPRRPFSSMTLCCFPTKGSITYQGQPIGGAFLALHPKEGSIADVPTATAVVQSDGRFAVTTYDTAATALWLLGIPIPPEFDGKPVASAFEAERPS